MIQCQGKAVGCGISMRLAWFLRQRKCHVQSLSLLQRICQALHTNLERFHSSSNSGLIVGTANPHPLSGVVG